MLLFADVFSDKNMNGGSRQGDVDTLTNCLIYCLSHPECGSVDFNVWNACWSADVKTECEGTLTDQSKTFHYRKLGICDLSKYLTASISCVI